MELDLTQGRSYSEAANGSTSAGRHTPTSAVHAPMAMGAGSTGIQTRSAKLSRIAIVLLRVRLILYDYAINILGHTLQHDPSSNLLM